MARGIDQSSHLLQLVPRWLVFFTGWSGYPAAAWARNRSAICSVFGRISGIFLYPPTGQIFGYVFDGYRPFVRYSVFGRITGLFLYLVTGQIFGRISDIFLYPVTGQRFYHMFGIRSDIRHFLVSAYRPDIRLCVRRLPARNRSAICSVFGIRYSAG